MKLKFSLTGAGAMAIIAALIFSASFFEYSKNLQLEKDRKLQELLAMHQREIGLLGEDISELRDQLGVEKKKNLEQTTALTMKLTEEQIKNAQAELLRLTENAKTSQKLTELEKGVTEAKSYDIAKIISEWRPRIAYIECDWKNSDGAVYKTQSGSGILTQEKNGYPALVTNRHVILDSNDLSPAICRFQLPDYGKTISVSTSQISISANGYDWARIDLDTNDSYLNSLSTKSFATCASEPSIGTNIVILGYPGIGSQTDITATEGIISGFDGNYFITSAKVEKGNSGGAAIMLKNNCYLGIPTFTKTGTIEALARILKAQFIFPAQ